MGKERFIKSQKELATWFKLVFFYYIILLVQIFLLNGFSNIFDSIYKVGIVNSYFSTLLCVVYLIMAGYAYFCVRLAKKGSKYAGINGILFGIFDILSTNSFWKILGLMIIIYSIKYLLYYKIFEN